MAFIVKEPCSRLDLFPDSPSPAVAALYRPDCSPFCFDSLASTCRWLADLLSVHGLCEVSFFDGSFFIINTGLKSCAFVSVQEVSSHAFHPFDVDAIFLLEANGDPLWLSHSNAHMASILDGCSKNELKGALDFAGCWYGTKASVRDLSSKVLPLICRKIEAVSLLKTSDLRSLVDCRSEFVSRSVLVFLYFSLCFGEDIVRKLMVPEYVRHDSNVVQQRNTFLTREQQVYNLRRFSKKDLKGVLRSIPCSRRYTTVSDLHSSLVDAVIKSFELRCEQVSRLSSQEFIWLVFLLGSVSLSVWH
jgi:hypothetical protein